MVEKLLEGFSWGIMVVGGLIPVAAFAIAWSWLGPKLKKPEESLLDTIFEEAPEMPEHEEPPLYRFSPSTIVRPPNVVRLKDVKKTEGNGEDDE